MTGTVKLVAEILPIYQLSDYELTWIYLQWFQNPVILRRDDEESSRIQQEILQFLLRASQFNLGSIQDDKFIANILPGTGFNTQDDKLVTNIISFQTRNDSYEKSPQNWMITIFWKKSYETNRPGSGCYWIIIVCRLDIVWKG
jgi:hypothetical protein